VPESVPNGNAGLRPHSEGAQPIDLPGQIASNISFIKRIIDKTLVNQPQPVQASVLFIFVFLFIYMVLVTTQGSIVLSTRLSVILTQDQLKHAQLSKNLIGKKITSLNPKLPVAVDPDPGFQIFYNDHYYGLNSDFAARLDVPMPSYLAALVSRHITVSIRSPENWMQPVNVSLEGFGLQNILLSYDDQASEIGFNNRIDRRAYRLSFAPSANAEIFNGGRLYVKGVSVPEATKVSEVTATLSVGNIDYALSSLSNNLQLQDDSPLAVNSDVVFSQGYRNFFKLPTATISAGGQIKLDGSRTL
jgi:hypothetical protein